ncbi:MAG: TIM barrel protein [Lachnospiraceae bacterium]
MNIKISGFADEICKELDHQLEVVKSLGMEYICFRGADGKGIALHTLESFQEEVAPKLKAEGIKLSSLGSPIGKVFIDDEEGFAKQLVQLEELCKIANYMDCAYIRMFSFFIKEDENPYDYTEQVIAKMLKFLEIAEKYQVILLHENEKDIYGDIADRCRIIFDRIKSPYFKGAFDFANFVQCDEDTVRAYEMLKDEMVYIHIKDATYADAKPVPFGTGDGQTVKILSDLIHSGYEGFLTLEPHLAKFGGLQDLELVEAAKVISKDTGLTGEEGFLVQYYSLQKVLDQIEA